MSQHGKVTDSSLGGRVIQRNSAVLQDSGEFFPLIVRILDCFDEFSRIYPLRGLAFRNDFEMFFRQLPYFFKTPPEIIALSQFRSFLDGAALTVPVKHFIDKVNHTF